MLRSQVAWPIVIVLIGTVLRLIVWNVNPPNNAFDDHLEVIAHFARDTARPSIDACFQCYHPPLYYLFSAFVLWLTHSVTESFWVAWQMVQLESVIFSVLHLLIAWHVLVSIGPKQLFPRVCAFGFFCLSTQAHLHIQLYFQ